MRYQFPSIQHLDDVRPAIEGRNEFIIAEREWGYVVNYMVAMADTFPPVVSEVPYGAHTRGFKIEYDEMAAIRRECRGLLFHKDGTIMSRRLHKFFNVNERDETQFSKIDFSQPHVVLEKLDGSMITPVIVGTTTGPDGIISGGYVRWGTKMGLTDVGMGAEEFVARNPDYARFAMFVMTLGITPVFEWCSRKQRIVIDYPEDRLVLIALRHTVTGEYKSYGEMCALGDQFGIDVVKAYDGDSEDLALLMDETRSSQGIEGWIVRFDDGHMLKVKGEWYLRIHKTKDHLSQEKNVVEMITSAGIDDIKSFMLDDDRKRLEAFESEFWGGIASSVDKYDKYWLMVQNAGLDRKTYALQWMPTIKDQDPFAPQFIFGKFDGKNTRNMIIDAIKKNCGTQTRIDSVRGLWEGAHWNYQFDGDS